MTISTKPRPVPLEALQPGEYFRTWYGAHAQLLECNYCEAKVRVLKKNGSTTIEHWSPSTEAYRAPPFAQAPKEEEEVKAPPPPPTKVFVPSPQSLPAVASLREPPPPKKPTPPGQPSNKQMVYELWLKDKNVRPEVCYEKVEGRVELSTVRNWLGMWRRGTGFPRR